MKFSVDEVDRLGQIVGRNIGNQDIPLGSTFTEIIRIQAGDRITVVASIQLTLKSVEFYHRNIEVIPSGHTARIKVEGDGLDTLNSVVQRAARESVCLACSA